MRWVHPFRDLQERLLSLFPLFSSGGVSKRWRILISRISKSVKNIHILDDLAAKNTPLNGLHPLVKLLAVLFYLATLLSFDRYNLSGILSMSVYLIILYDLADLSLRQAAGHIKNALLLLSTVGLFNLFFDTSVVLTIGGHSLSGGVVSLAVLLLKGLFSMLSVYLLIAVTGMESLCAALDRLHMPSILTTTLLLIYRYLILLLQGGERISTAYALRAPTRRGIHPGAWGPLLGQLLLRTVDRAQTVYESMQLRGFRGSFSYAHAHAVEGRDILFLCLSSAYFFICRIFPVFEYIGGIFRNIT